MPVASDFFISFKIFYPNKKLKRYRERLHKNTFQSGA